MSTMLKAIMDGQNKEKPVYDEIEFPNVQVTDMFAAAYRHLTGKELSRRRGDWDGGKLTNGLYRFRTFAKDGDVEIDVTFSKTERVKPAVTMETLQANPGHAIELFPGCVAMSLASPEDVPAMVEMIEPAVGESAPPVTAKPQTVYLVTAEHFNVPGFINQPFASKEGATAEAVNLINLMLKDTSAKRKPKPATAETWESVLDWLQDYHGAQYCFVEIAATEVKP
jgi:hypothetical protein